MPSLISQQPKMDIGVGARGFQRQAHVSIRHMARQADHTSLWPAGSELALLSWASCVTITGGKGDGHLES
jgi:hypothetical protein